jgi:hypothetical protein
MRGIWGYGAGPENSRTNEKENNEHASLRYRNSDICQEFKEHLTDILLLNFYWYWFFTVI